MLAIVTAQGGLLPRSRLFRGRPLAERDIQPNKESYLMSVKTKTAQGNAVKFANMGTLQKLVFIGKTSVFLLTFGFAFPNILGE